MTVGEKVKMLREAQNMTQEELARAVGYKTRSSITKIETGEADPTQKKLMKLAAALGVSPAELLGDSESEGDPPKTREAKIVSHGLDNMPPDARERALGMFRLAFPIYFDEGENSDDA